MLLNGNTTSCFNSSSPSTKKLLNDLAEIKQLKPGDLHSWLTEDYTNFSVLSVSAKHIQSTNRLTITLSKNSAQSFYVNQARKSQRYCPCLTNHQIKTNSNGTYSFCSPNCSLKTWLHPIDNCLIDAQNCLYFNLFNSKEKKLYTRFLDKFEANFEGEQYLDSAKTVLDIRPQFFGTFTFNTTDTEHYSWTRNWDPSDPIWDKLKKPYLKNWAQSADPQVEPMKVFIPKLEVDVSQYSVALSYLQLFFRRVRRLWKPPHWKWVVVAELQKAKNDRPATWHFHLLSTPIVPYSHKCTLSKENTSCWDCRAYLNSLWPYGRVEMRSLKGKSRKAYLAKYISKSFHHHQLYREHGLKEHHKTYSFFKNLYRYEQKEALLIDKSKLDAQTNQFLPKNQKVFRLYDYQTKQNSYFYRTSEVLIGKAQKPRLLKKNFRLGTRSLNPLNLLKLASKSKATQTISFKKPPKTKTTHTDFTNPLCDKETASPRDFQEFLITNLLTFCKSAEFLHLPLEQNPVPKLKSKCDGTVYHHFKPKPILHFKFTPESVPLVLSFINNLDTYAQEYDMEESSEFYDSRFTDLTESRNAYLNQWQINTWYYRKENAVSQQNEIYQYNPLGETPG